MYKCAGCLVRTTRDTRRYCIDQAMIDLTTVLIALVGALFGGGGVAAWQRARGQNRVDYLTTVINRLSVVETREDLNDKLLGELSTKNAELSRDIGREQGERAVLERSVLELRALARELTAQVGTLAERVSDETRQRANAIHHEQVQRSRADFLERENNVLRAELTASRTPRAA